MNTPRVSVIVPVFNGEAYVAECIESLLVQTLRDIEIILIDDGSTDGTGRICREYAESDDRIVLIQQENAGVSAARNAGLRVAKGEYLAFADADDLMLEDGVQRLYDSARRTGADLVVGAYLVCKGDERCLVLPAERQSDAELLSSLLEGKNHSALWNKLVKRESLGRLRFDDRIRYAEDQVLLTEFLLFCKPGFSFQHSPVYVHRLGSESATASGGAALFDLFSAKRRMGELILKEDVPGQVRGSYERGAVSCVPFVVRNVGSHLLKRTRDEVSGYGRWLKGNGVVARNNLSAKLLFWVSSLPETAAVTLFRVVRAVAASRLAMGRMVGRG